MEKSLEGMVPAQAGTADVQSLERPVRALSCPSPRPLYIPPCLWAPLLVLSAPVPPGYPGQAIACKQLLSSPLSPPESTQLLGDFWWHPRALQSLHSIQVGFLGLLHSGGCSRTCSPHPHPQAFAHIESPLQVLLQEMARSHREFTLFQIKSSFFKLNSFQRSYV